MQQVIGEFAPEHFLQELLGRAVELAARPRLRGAHRVPALRRADLAEVQMRRQPRRDFAVRPVAVVGIVREAIVDEDRAAAVAAPSSPGRPVALECPSPSWACVGSRFQSASVSPGSVPVHGVKSGTPRSGLWLARREAGLARRACRPGRARPIRCGSFPAHAAGSRHSGGRSRHAASQAAFTRRSSPRPRRIVPGEVNGASTGLPQHLGDHLVGRAPAQHQRNLVARGPQGCGAATSAMRRPCAIRRACRHRAHRGNHRALRRGGGKGRLSARRRSCRSQRVTGEVMALVTPGGPPGSMPITEA